MGLSESKHSICDSIHSGSKQWISSNLMLLFLCLLEIHITTNMTLYYIVRTPSIERQHNECFLSFNEIEWQARQSIYLSSKYNSNEKKISNPHHNVCAIKIYK